MNTQEQQMILELGEKIGNTSVVNKDNEADKLINEYIASKKDAVYIMTQAVLIQQHALEDLQKKIRQLEFQVADNHQKKGFFSSLFGAKNLNTSTHHSHPPRDTDKIGKMAYQNNGMSNYAEGRQSKPERSGPSFLSSAMSTALGVAGGMALFNGLEHMFSHGHENVTTDSAISDTNAPSFLSGENDYLHEQNAVSDQEFSTFSDAPDVSSEMSSYDAVEQDLDFGESFDDENFI